MKDYHHKQPIVDSFINSVGKKTMKYFLNYKGYNPKKMGRNSYHPLMVFMDKYDIGVTHQKYLNIDDMEMIDYGL